jgi:leader peptidase (prepilin peptidase)/N-methyltransferase
VTLPLALLVAILVGAVTACVTGPVLGALPEPALAEGEVKVRYRDLPRHPLALGAGVWAAALTLATVGSLPPTAWAPYVVLAVVGSVGCIIDAATTWLPSRILHVGWVVVPLCLAGATALGGGGDGWAALVRALVGAVVVGGLMLVAHLVASFGFSDVRLGLLTGAVGAWVSWQTLVGGLLLGSVVGAAWGLAHAWRAGRTPFAYGPSLLFGPYLAVLVAAVTR